MLHSDAHNVFQLNWISVDAYAVFIPLLATHSKRVMDIDVVYTWVNHLDPEWQTAHRRATSQRSIPSTEHKSVNDPARFTNRDELYYSIQTVLMCAQWVRNIFIVTNCNKPPWFDDFENVYLITHTELFPNSVSLPIFNSRAIETVLHRIPGLSEHFLYLNDDFFYVVRYLQNSFSFPRII